MSSTQQSSITTVENLSNQQKTILKAVTLWHTATTWTVNGIQYNIAYSYEPSLQELFDCDHLQGMSWTAELSEAHEALLCHGVLQSESLCGKHCKWLFTEKGRRLANNLLQDEPSAYPFWAKFHGHGPLNAGDPNELTHHRKAVATARYQFGRLDRITDIEMYPGRDKNGYAPDILLYDNKNKHPWAVEAMMHNNDRDRWLQKWQAFARNTHHGIWVFQNRKTMVQFFNHIHRQTSDEPYALTLPGGQITSDPTNWAAETINRKLQTARTSSQYVNNSARLVYTMTGLFRSDKADVDQWVNKALANEF